MTGHTGQVGNKRYVLCTNTQATRGRTASPTLGSFYLVQAKRGKIALLDNYVYVCRGVFGGFRCLVFETGKGVPWGFGTVIKVTRGAN